MKTKINKNLFTNVMLLTCLFFVAGLFNANAQTGSRTQESQKAKQNLTPTEQKAAEQKKSEQAVQATTQTEIGISAPEVKATSGGAQVKPAQPAMKNTNTVSPAPKAMEIDRAGLEEKKQPK